MKLKVVSLSLLVVLNVNAQFKDSTNKQFLKRMITPTSILAVSLAAYNQNFKEKQISFHDKNLSSFKTKLDDYLNYAPAATFVILSLAEKENRGERLIRGTLAISAANGTSWILKRIINEERPDKSEKFSFPSGHTTNAFAGAAVLNREFSNKYPLISVLGFAAATSTGILRVANNKHWITDVIAGAALGIGATEVTYFIYPKLKKLLHIKTNKNAFVPYYNGQSFGIASTISL